MTKEEKLSVIEKEFEFWNGHSTDCVMAGNYRLYTPWLITELKSAWARESEISEAFRKMVSEASALLYAHEDSIRADYGNTNIECLTLRIDESNKILEKQKDQADE